MYKTVLFDLDGTLTDSGLGITNSAAYALKRYGITETDRKKLDRFVGPPLSDSFERFYGLSKKQSAEAIYVYREYYDTKGIFENEVYDGIPELLAKLKADGKKILVATSKPEPYAIKIMEHFGLSKYFDYIAGANMDETRSDKQEIIMYALSEVGVTDISSVIMVGDREYDIIGAKKVGADSIGVTYGYGSRDELENAGATFIAENPSDIYNIIKGGERKI